MPYPAFPKAAEALRDNQAYYELVRIHMTHGALEGFFWIFGDALMWQVPDDDAWSGWQAGLGLLPETPRSGVIQNRTKLARLPATSLESQAAADMILTRQSELLQIKTDGGDALDTLGTATDDPIASLLPTPPIYDALYLAGDVRIQFEYVPGLEKPHPPPIEEMALAYNRGVNQKMAARVDAKPPLDANGKPRSPRSLATPGKIWAVHEDMERYQWEPGSRSWYVCAINYGFHYLQEGQGKPRVQQTPGSSHNEAHVDYSQIVVCVAGYCVVKGGPGDTSFVWKPTADVYQSRDYAPLVNISGKPLERVRYTGTAADENPGNRQGPRWVPVT